MKFVVVGGGTAGWLTSLFLRSSFINDEITVIESQEIGIIGAGEGTTPQIIPALQFLQIPLSDLIKFTDATIKHSIQFVNWRGNSDYYFHGFTPRSDLSMVRDSFDAGMFINAVTDESYAYAEKFDDPYEAHNIFALLSAMNRSPFAEISADLKTTRHEMDLYDRVSNYAVHFNAVRLAEFLRSIATHRGVKHVEGRVAQINTDSGGNIESFDLDNKENIEADFVFDCTGFQREIIGRHYKSKWNSFKDFLPADRAISYFKPMIRPTPAYTTAVAMENGWSWQIPLQTRYGSGYVYSSSFTTEEKVQDEISQREDDEDIEWGRSFSFEPGYYEDIWINNCVAIGLSSGFLEPLEATSIMQTLILLERVCSMKLNLLEAPKREKRLFSKLNGTVSREIADFLYLHYLTDRSDTEFWQQFHYGAQNMPESVAELLAICKYRLPTKNDVNAHSFSIYNYMSILDGTGSLGGGRYSSFFENRRIDRTEDYMSIRRNVGIAARNCLDNDTFLGMMRRS